jgi:hypothetical protein
MKKATPGEGVALFIVCLVRVAKREGLASGGDFDGSGGDFQDGRDFFGEMGGGAEGIPPAKMRLTKELREGFIENEAGAVGVVAEGLERQDVVVAVVHGVRVVHDLGDAA